MNLQHSSKPQYVLLLFNGFSVCQFFIQPCKIQHYAEDTKDHVFPIVYLYWCSHLYSSSRTFELVLGSLY